MADKSDIEPISSKIKKFWQSEGSIPSAIREVLSVLVTVGGIVAVLYLICGTWPAIVTIESESMVPNMNVGDLVLVMAPDRLGPVQSMVEGNRSGYQMFGKPGDVIIYRPNGVVNYPREVLEPGVPHNLISDLSWNIRTLLGWNQVHPIIHRALIWIEEGPTNITYRSYDKITGISPLKQYIAPNSGYITKGDNNPVIDQTGFGNNYRGLGSAIQPVKHEWIVGKAIFSIPLIGILPLHIKEVIVIVIALMFIHELYLRSKRNEQKSGKKKKNKQ